MRSASKPPLTTIFTCWKPSASSALRTLCTSCALTPVGLNVPICGITLLSTSVPEVSSRTPHSRSPSARATASDVPAQSLSKSTSAMTFTEASMYCANFCVARTVSPPYAAISACGTVPIPRDPHHSVVEARRKEQHFLAAGGVDDRARVGRDPRAAREDAEIRCLEVREERVVAFDRHHRLERLDRITVVQRPHGQPVPALAPRAVRRVAPAAQLEDRDRLVDPAQHRLIPLEHLHPHARMVGVLFEDLARPLEVDVRVVALAHLLDRQVEDRRVETTPLGGEHGTPLRGRGTKSSSYADPDQPRDRGPLARDSHAHGVRGRGVLQVHGLR